MNTNAEYERQHFGFSAEQVSLERRHGVQKHLSNVSDEILKKLKSNVSESAVKLLLEEQQNEVVSRMCKTFEQQLQDLQNLDQKYFSVPENVLLPTDFCHSKQYTEQNEKVLDKEIEIMKRHFLENSVMIASLKAENAQYMQLQPLIQEELMVHDLVERGIKSYELKTLRELVDSTKKFLELK